MKLFVCIALLAVGSAFAEELTAESKAVIAKIQELSKQEEALFETLTEEQSDAVEHTLVTADEKAVAEIEAETKTEVEATRVKRGAKSVRARRAQRKRNLRKHRQNVRKHRQNVRRRNIRRQRNLRRQANGRRLRNVRHQRNQRRFAASRRAAAQRHARG